MENIDPCIPLHIQIRRFLEGKIQKGSLSPGAALPTEPELMRQFNVSRGTVRKAYDALVGAGLVERSSGRGSFVSKSAASPRQPICIGVIIYSPALFENQHNPVNWEMNVDKLNGVVGAATALGVGIEVIPYSPGLLDCYGEIAGFVMMGEFPDLMEKLERDDGRPYSIVLEREENIEKGVNFCLKSCFGEAVRFLFMQGFRRVGFLGLPDNQRLLPYRQELKNHGLRYDRNLVEEAAVGTPEDGYEAARRLFARNNGPLRPDAVFCTTDLRALGVIDYLRDQGI
jgi:hypothetical protein